ncbi:MAG: hypothetical protein AAF639_23655 [Chloroflexota bacterium]
MQAVTYEQAKQVVSQLEYQDQIHLIEYLSSLVASALKQTDTVVNNGNGASTSGLTGDAANISVDTAEFVETQSEEGKKAEIGITDSPSVNGASMNGATLNGASIDEGLSGEEFSLEAYKLTEAYQKQQKLWQLFDEMGASGPDLDTWLLNKAKRRKENRYPIKVGGKPASEIVIEQRRGILSDE